MNNEQPEQQQQDRPEPEPKKRGRPTNKTPEEQRAHALAYHRAYQKKRYQEKKGEILAARKAKRVPKQVQPAAPADE